MTNVTKWAHIHANWLWLASQLYQSISLTIWSRLYQLQNMWREVIANRTFIKLS